MTIEAIIFYILLVDALGANLVAWFGAEWYTKSVGMFGRLFPASKGWAMYYLALVLWAGSLLYRSGVLF